MSKLFTQESCWGSFFVRADGVITGQLERHRTALLLSTIDREEELYDSTAWRTRALHGTLHMAVLYKMNAQKNAQKFESFGGTSWVF
ncbi:MAG: hypothetical protein R2865_07750 [Deinococcales bacterium]